MSLIPWVAHLRHIAASVPGDDEGDLRLGPLQTPFLTALGELAGAEQCPQAGSAPDVALWWAIVDNSVDVDSTLPTGSGSLFPQGTYRAIEVWTESDLCGLHALWRLARLRDRADWRARAESVRDWHLVNTQPDNATNRPWALHVFLLADQPEATHYAETLLHNSQVLHGRPDPVSRRILLDAAREVELAAR